jgi:hypothetical protein
VLGPLSFRADSAARERPPLKIGCVSAEQVGGLRRFEAYASRAGSRDETIPARILFVGTLEQLVRRGMLKTLKKILGSERSILITPGTPGFPGG